MLPVAHEAVALLGHQIAARRRELAMTAESVAERAGISRSTLSKIEGGNPGVAIGSVFNVAAIVQLPLFPDATDRSLRTANRNERAYLGLLPQRVDRRPVDDDF